MNKALTILTLILSVLSYNSALACSCDGVSAIENAYKNSDVVFSGRVIEKETVWIPDSSKINELIELGFPPEGLDKRLNGIFIVKVSILIEDVFKGGVEDTLIIYTGKGSGACGYQFEKDKKYIIYGDSESYLRGFINEKSMPNGNNVYWTNICTRTQKISRSEVQDLKNLKNQ